MLNAIQKRAWGESWLINIDPTAFVKFVEPAIGDALEAMDDRDEMASVLIDLYRGHGEPGTLARVLEATVWTGSGALYAAVQKTVSQSGRTAIALLEEALSDEEELAVGYLFDGCRTSVRAIRDPAERLGVLRAACEGALAGRG